MKEMQIEASQSTQQRYKGYGESFGKAEEPR